MKIGDSRLRKDDVLHCPVCGRELGEAERRAEGYLCRCGEAIPVGLALSAFEGCTHGRNCNCSREMRR